jgi:phosphoribosylaminoimidazolecarboxamide formyltransferase/IMP cyclohydrolase
MKVLLSVFDKSGIENLGTRLFTGGAQLISTGGTYKTLTDNKLDVTQVAEITGFPEMLDGRVKTLHPNIHGGILANRNIPAHLEELKQMKIDPIDVVVVNLYPFSDTINKPDCSLDEALENIDIGGPTMIRAAAKNFKSVAVIVDPEDYDWVATKLLNSDLNLTDRKFLAAKAFKHVSEYDRTINLYLSTKDKDIETLPQDITLNVSKIENLRYGENPHQKAGLYAITNPASTGLAGAKQIHGKELSFNNIMDADAAWKTVNEFHEPTVSIVKHGNSCGLCTNQNLSEAYKRAFEGDATSAFGGIVGTNSIVTTEMAELMNEIFYEVLVAPGYEDGALEILQKKRNLRILVANHQPITDTLENYDYRVITGGFLIQNQDFLIEDATKWKTVTRREPNEAEYEDLMFAWKAAKHIKSNAIVFAKDKTLTGMGAGQPNRVVSVHLSQRVAGLKAPGSVLASDAFFPFPDNIELASEAGITAIIQPGGSIRDEEVINAANQHNIAMVFTKTRHFKH